MSDDLAFAHELADIADEVAMSLFGRPTDVDTKQDGSLVGEADLAIEGRLVDLVRRHRPDDAILTEETGAHGESYRRWIIDPIDGTNSFLAGESHWGVHVALEIEHEIVVAVVTRPAVGMRWWAAKGAGAWRGHVSDGAVSQAELLRVRSTPQFSDCLISTGLTDEAPYDRLVNAAHWVGPTYNNLVRVLDGEIDVMIVRGKDLGSRSLRASPTRGRGQSA